MKAKIEEFDNCYYVTFEPEDVKEVVSLTRMAMNVTAKPMKLSAYFNTSGTMGGELIVSKRARGIHSIMGGKCR
jgi:hypothetical protein